MYLILLMWTRLKSWKKTEPTLYRNTLLNHFRSTIDRPRRVHSRLEQPFLVRLIIDVCRVVYRIGIFRSVSVGISRYLPYRYQKKSRSVHFGIIFLAGTPFSLKKVALVPFLRKRGAQAPFLMQPAPLLWKKGVPVKLVIPTGNTDRQVNLVPAKYWYTKKTAGNTVVSLDMTPLCKIWRIPTRYANFYSRCVY